MLSALQLFNSLHIMQDYLQILVEILAWVPTQPVTVYKYISIYFF